MSSSYTVSQSDTFTVTHARHMAAKVATDLKRMQRFYGQPSDTQIAQYEQEIIEYLKSGYLLEVTYGFRRNGSWIEPTLRYTARDLVGSAETDDDPGRVRAGADIANAQFYSYLIQNAYYSSQLVSEQEAFQKRLPIARPGAAEPGVNGYLVDDLTYSAGGKALVRKSVRNSG